MRVRLIIGIAALVVLIPQAAMALCMQQAFDDVVRSSDAVLVATVADAVPTGNQQSGITVRLDVEQVLKGSADDGQSVSISSCGPVIAGPGAVSMAHGMIGTRELFLLSDAGGGTFTRYSEITTPQGMTLDQRIAEARHVLGLPADPAVHDAGGMNSRWAWALWTFLVAAIAVLVVVRRARRSSGRT